MPIGVLAGIVTDSHLNKPLLVVLRNQIMMRYARLLLVAVTVTCVCSCTPDKSSEGVKGRVSEIQEKVFRTPKPGPEPHINGPVVYGCRGEREFIYRIPCTGQRPIKFAAHGLPGTLHLNAETGIITGRTPEAPGDYDVRLEAKNSHGSSSRGFHIVVGDTLALTPPMGWNSWYIHYNRVTDADMRAAADAMIDSGMADFGYQYVNIDDCWMVKPDANDPMIAGEPRDATGAIRSNKLFPDMKALTDYIHAKGLKAGIYTSPGPLTCQSYTGSYEHEMLDATQFAEWGFDFLKHDWCFYENVATGEGL